MPYFWYTEYKWYFSSKVIAGLALIHIKRTWECWLLACYHLCIELSPQVWVCWPDGRLEWGLMPAGTRPQTDTCGCSNPSCTSFYLLDLGQITCPVWSSFLIWRNENKNGSYLTGLSLDKKWLLWQFALCHIHSKCLISDIYYRDTLWAAGFR